MATSKILIQNAYQSMAEVKAAAGEYEAAYQYRLSYEGVRDSIQDLEARQKVDEFEARFRSEQRQKMLDFLLRQDKLTAEELALREEREANLKSH